MTETTKHTPGPWKMDRDFIQAYEMNQTAPNLAAYLDARLNLVTITVEDRLRGAVVEALSQLEQGYPTAAHQVLRDALKIKGL